MEYAAVVAAAGRSSRMGQFKPLLKLGSLSVIEHVISAFHQAGVSRIVVVTGRNAHLLREHLSGCGVSFVHNERYETTQMFDSVRLGLSVLEGFRGHVFFTPADIPLFSPLTVRALMKSGGDIAAPVYGGRQGHPLLLSTDVLGGILADSGAGGLKGAVSRAGVPITQVETDDPAILRDADTPEDFCALREQYRLYARCPSDGEIRRLLDEAGTPEPVRAHGEAVAAKAAQLAAQCGQDTDAPLLRAACLLHDMLRADRPDHAAAAADLLRRKGCPALAEIVGLHHDLSLPASTEAQLLYLADKLIQGTREVSLQERFAASRRKCAAPEAVQSWERRYRSALLIARDCGLSTTEMEDLYAETV